MKNEKRLYADYSDVLDTESDPTLTRLVGALDVLFQVDAPPLELRESIAHMAEEAHPGLIHAAIPDSRSEVTAHRGQQVVYITRPQRLIFALSGISLKNRRVVIGMAALLLALISAVILVPSLVAQVIEWSKPQIVFEVPNGHGQAAAIDWPGFQPLNPTYLPEASWQFSSGGEDENGIKYLTLTYLLDNQFIRILQSKAGTARNLPQGMSIQVNGRPAVLITGLHGTIPFTKITYSDAHQISWYYGDTRVDLVSNLSDTEMLKVAESLVPAKQREVKFLVLPNGADAPYPLFTPVPQRVP